MRLARLAPRGRLCFAGTMRCDRATMKRVAAGAIVPLALAACSAGNDQEADPAPVSESDFGAAPSDAPAPEAFAGTAWRAIARDGARYTTYLDTDGRYRDLRNGDPWHSGSWRYLEGEDNRRLCLKPDDENGLERCWEPGRMSGETMRAESDSGTLIELERVDYQPPADTTDAAA